MAGGAPAMPGESAESRFAGIFTSGRAQKQEFRSNPASPDARSSAKLASRRRIGQSSAMGTKGTVNETRLNADARAQFVEIFANLAVAAGAAIMGIYHAGAKVRLKADSSPVSDADEAAESIILAGLARHAANIPVVAEEAAAAGRIPQTGALFILVDPLDGTREFISRNGEFTVNIALIEHGAPVAGVVYAPALETIWTGGVEARRAHMPWNRAAGNGAGAYTLIKTRPAPAKGLTALGSRSHPDPETAAYLQRLNVAETIAAGSSLKFCRLAEGAADVYARCGPTMEWDIAAGDAVLRAAGGLTRDANGAPVVYGKQSFRSGSFVAWGDQAAEAPTLAQTLGESIP
jgi:3'(2'),5'-bisphosphate nucleotidase